MQPDARAIAPLRVDIALAGVATLAVAATWAAVFGHWAVGALFLMPGTLFPAFALPIALSTLRARRGLAALAYLVAAAAYPLVAYWGRFPYLVGQIPSPSQLGVSDVLAGLPCAAFGLLLLRRPRPVSGVPGPGVLLDALQAVVAVCIVGILVSAVARGGQFGVAYFSASLALFAGLTKAAVVEGAVVAAATVAIARSHPAPRHLGMAGAFAALAGIPVWFGSGEAAVAWVAAFALTLIAHASRRPARARAPSQNEATIPAAA